MKRSIWERLGFVRTSFQVQEDAAEAGIRWTRALRAEPELASDLIRMGGVMTAQPFQNGEVADLDPHRLAYEAGQRDLALRLLALGNLSPKELKTLMGDDHVY